MMIIRPTSSALYEVPSLTDIEAEVIDRIDEVRRNISYATRARRWTGTLARMSFARDIQGSNSIEGYQVSVDDAMAIAGGEEPLEAEGETREALTGYRNAMTYVLELADDPHFSYSRGLIRSLHYMMVQHDLTKNPGKWRPGPIFVRNEATGERVYEGPDADVVNGLMETLVAFLRQPHDEIHPMVLAAWSHLNLVMIHPFSDGNGRMGRALQTLVLARGGIVAKEFCSIEEYLGSNRQDYYNVLADVGAGSWHPERDAKPWIRFCLTAHYRQAQTLMKRARVIQKLWDALEVETTARGLPDRVVGVLAEAALALRVRNATYRKTADISENLASRDLKTLTDHGLLIPKGERRGRHYIGSEQLLSFGREAVAGEPLKVPDPFEPESRLLPGFSPR